MTKKQTDKIFIFLFVVIIIIGTFFRLYQLDLKPMHHDEGEEINLFFDKMMAGETLVWDYDNKGLWQHYLSYPVTKIFGLSLITVRFTPALLGILSIALLYFFKDRLGRIGVLVSGLFLAISPYFIYYSKQYTTYPFSVFFTILLLLLFLKFIDLKRSIYLYLSFVCLAILFNINLEATVIFLAAVVSFFYLYYLFNKSIIDKFNNYQEIIAVHLKYALLLFVFVFVMIQTGFFQNYNNLINLFTSFADLGQKAFETGHNKGIVYYLKLLFPYEFSFLFFSLMGVFLFKRDIFSKFIVYWFLFFFSIFSLIPYKTNWTIIYIILPMVFLAGLTVKFLSKDFGIKKPLIYLSVIIFTAASLIFTVDQNFIHINDLAKNRIGYVETSVKIYDLIDDIGSYIANNPDSKILITADSYWPLPVLLKDYDVLYLSDIEQLNVADYPDYNILIINEEQLDDNDLSDFYSNEYELRHYYNLKVLFRGN